MVSVNVGGPEGTLSIEAGGAKHLATLVLFPNAGGNVPPGKVYIGEAYDFYRESHQDQRGKLFDQDALGEVRPAQGANMVVAHDKRHTDWNEGPRAEFRDGKLYLLSRFDDWVEYPIQWAGSMNPTHSEGGVEVESSDLGTALDKIGF